MFVSRALAPGLAAAVAGLVLCGCGTRLTQAPVEDRGTASSSTPAPQLAAAKPLPGAENAGKPGYYTVKPGDTLIRIGLESGQGWKDIARWNDLENADRIEVDQVLRVVPPPAAASTPAPAPAPASASGVVTRPVAASSVVPAAAASPPAPKPAASPAPAPGTVVAVAPTVPAPAASAGENGMAFAWPASGTLIAGFDEARNKGYDIGGKAGDPVLAAADGRVVYAGAGLRGYGNLIVIQHNDAFLTAYAHNQAMLVKDEQSVRKGQKIAEMGRTDADRVKLHFEIRRHGKPVDPSRYLPAR
ncbi:LysM peptidoglycan-binding domain-containing protein [Verminephrobacter aporrectodeae subsp. tuberculatae]|uniref:peptidoglycan DD-metalloendopeptidase family protein n=1 Tax=Verminephrobacter aporrectodeae TaxID=1110389 RepID=UPI0022390B8E|nr:peptidoglycan DD-metalloendopeptidase family protein [Verminephrobacter aporrectodeae]MCW5220502.1 LysM peptidoglycan-binding domain-containing protein [Verminephrobacter aporrectodeae subsp. tuberculatae]MCW5289798.1 LysM peptidoglycan-binding domain-containing protein [Verminephrobacter aporrectodeae subsp. tuberculatae]